MRKIINVYLLAADTLRSRAYVDILSKEKLKFEHAIIFGKKKYKKRHSLDNTLYNDDSLTELLTKSGTEFTEINHSDINSIEIFNELKKIKKKYIVFAGMSGSILNKRILSLDHQFIHIHPGDLPDFRGSTTIYYSLLKNGKITATAIFMNEKIDEGRIIDKMDFEPPEDRSTIDYSFDPLIRSKLLLKIILNYLKKRKINGNKQKGNGITYHVIHPILKHIAILGKNKKKGIKI